MRPRRVGPEDLPLVALRSGPARKPASRRAGALLIGLALASPPAHAADPKPGAYCPIPEPGKPSTCLQPAQQRYQEFFGALDEGGVGDEASARLEADLLAGVEGARRYQALSSLAYGYFRLAKRAAETPGADPLIQARLERWNGLLAQAYETSDADPGYRAAVREAAEDVHRRAPPAGVRCLDAQGRTAQCSSTEAVIRGIDAVRDQAGVRGQLTRIFSRLFGSAP